MVVGQTLFYMDGNIFYSPEFPRGGLAATFTVDAQQVSMAGGIQLDIIVEHRNSEDTSWTVAGSFAGITSTGPVSVDLTALKEIVRFSYSFGGGTPVAADGVHFLMMAPSWRPY